MRRTTLKKLGRSDEALQAAWEDYEQTPMDITYETLLKTAVKGQRAQWRERALSCLDGASLDVSIEVFLSARAWDRLADAVDAASRADLMELSHYATEPAANKLERKHPIPAARIYVALALRILEAKKSRYYGAALEHLDVARRLLEKGGLREEWDALTDEIRLEHRRKSAFMPGFERMLRGLSPIARPSFRDRARRRWDH